MNKGDRVRVKATGDLGWLESIAPGDVLVRLDQKTPHGNLISFQHSELEVVSAKSSPEGK